MAVFGLWLPTGDTTFILEIDVGGCVEHLLQPAGADQRRGPVQLIDLAHFFRDFE